MAKSVAQLIEMSAVQGCIPEFADDIAEAIKAVEGQIVAVNATAALDEKLTPPASLTI